MNTIFIRTGDGSPTLFVPELNEYYHSMFGAIRESAHVYIENALNEVTKQNIRLFEIGFGSGMNALLTCKEAVKTRKTIYYHSIDKYPLASDVCQEFQNYFDETLPDLSGYYKLINECPWGKEIQLTKYFSLKKINCDLLTYSPSGYYDIIFFDAFGPRVQPEMWTAEVFSKIAGIMEIGAILATYSANGQVRRNMMTAGLETKRIPGPPGKREMLAAIKRGPGYKFISK